MPPQLSSKWDNPFLPPGLPTNGSGGGGGILKEDNNQLNVAGSYFAMLHQLATAATPISLFSPLPQLNSSCLSVPPSATSNPV